MSAPSKNRTKQTLDLTKHFMRACPEDYMVTVIVKYGSRVSQVNEYPSLALSICSDDAQRRGTIAYAVRSAMMEAIEELFPIC